MLSVNELAKKLNVSPSTIRKWSSNGRIPTNRTDGGHRRYVYEDVLAALDEENPALPKRCLIYINSINPKEHEKYSKMAIFYAQSNDWKIAETINDYSGKLNVMNELFEEGMRLIITNKVNRLILPYKTLLGMYGKQQTLETLCKIKRVKVVYLENRIGDIAYEDIDEINKIKDKITIGYMAE